MSFKDYVEGGYLHHPVKKVWNKIVSIGDYTFDKCVRLKKGLCLHYEGEKMFLPFEDLSLKKFHLHEQIVPSKFGRPYKMIDFAWRPEKLDQGQ